MPVTINGSGQSASFSYAPDRSRWRQISTYSTGSETTIYVGELLEKLTTSVRTHWRHLIPTPSANVYYVRRSDGTSDTVYAVQDHLGSTDVLMAGSGTFRESFTAYGARRGSSWSGSPTSTEWQGFADNSRRGYTGHEMLDNVNLVHMNGRVYDPVVGRFLSSDPIEGKLCNPQSFNLFAYVLNSPLRYADPSGFEVANASITVTGRRFYPSVGGNAGTGGGVGNASGSRGRGNDRAKGPDGDLGEIVVSDSSETDQGPKLPPILVGSLSFSTSQIRGNLDKVRAALDTAHKSCVKDCVARAAPVIQAGAGGVAGFVGGLVATGNVGVAAGAGAAGAVGGLVSGSLDAAGAPKWLNAVISGKAGYVLSAVAAQFTTSGGATVGASTIGGWSGAIGALVPGAPGAGIGSAVGALPDGALSSRAGIAILAAGLTGAASYALLESGITRVCDKLCP
jgi:RHS repeat-associated protein